MSRHVLKDCSRAGILAVPNHSPTFLPSPIPLFHSLQTKLPSLCEYRTACGLHSLHLFFEECPTSCLDHATSCSERSQQPEVGLNAQRKECKDMRQNGMEPRASIEMSNTWSMWDGEKSIKIATTSDISRKSERQRK